jgi:hypothetical protein
MLENGHNKDLPSHFMYWRLIYQYVLAKHQLHHSELDLILFLQPLHLFTNKKVREFDCMLPWHPNRLKDLEEKGLVYKFDEENHRAVIWSLTSKAMQIVQEVYAKAGLTQTASLRKAGLSKKSLSYKNKRLVEALNHFNNQVKVVLDANHISRSRVLSYTPKFNSAWVITNPTPINKDERKVKKRKEDKVYWDEYGNPITP